MCIRDRACAKDSFVAIKTGIPRQAIVIGIYTYFVHVQLESGVCESVMWADLINASEAVSYTHRQIRCEADYRMGVDTAEEASGYQNRQRIPHFRR